MTTLANKNVLIVGFGKSGQAAARYCVAQGAQVTVTDMRAAAEFTNHLPTFTGQMIQFVWGHHPAACFAQADLVIVSPGVPLLPELQQVKLRGVPVIGEMELAVQQIQTPIVAITGTNGKSTTTALIGHLLQSAGKRVCVGGNIGTPILDLLSDAQAADVVVLEVSSYQLEITPSLKPHVAVLLNITADHLDRYANMAAYAAAKALIVRLQGHDDFCIYNEEDPLVVAAVANTKAQRRAFAATGESGTWSLADTQLQGAHNLENVMAACMVAEVLGVTPAALRAGLKTFQGLPHRLQWVRKLNGVNYYDDSKGTNVGAVIKSLAGFVEPVHLIAGGHGKGTRYNDLRPMVAAHVKTLILLGHQKAIMKEDLGDLVPTHLVASMGEAVQAAHDLAKPGEVVLLSPACASFDMFKDYADRGQQFTECVQRL